MSIEEDYPDVLQNLESAVIQFYRAHPELTDFAVLEAYGAATDLYSAEQRGVEPRKRALNDLQTELFDHVSGVCEYLLGRAELKTMDGGSVEREVIDHTILIRCLRKLQKSVPKWTKRGGRQGYLNFVSNFV
jgi:hypothetical protein